MGLSAEKRYQHILETLNLNGKVYVPTTATELKVTEVTIRRDLNALEKTGLLKKTYGGAVLEEKPDINGCQSPAHILMGSQIRMDAFGQCVS